MNKHLYLDVREQTRQMSVKIDLTLNWQILKNCCYQMFFQQFCVICAQPTLAKDSTCQ